jgi:hypothetical protein
LDALATELSLPFDIAYSDEFLRDSEAARIRMPRRERRAQAIEELRNRHLTQFRRGGETYEGRSFSFEIEGQDLPFNVITARQGLNRELLRWLTSLGPDLEDEVEGG